MNARRTRHARAIRLAALGLAIASAGATWYGGGAGAWAAGTGAGPAAAPDGAEDVRARDLFQARRYPEALAIYERLHAETRHPTYLRNMGRCRQMMAEPDPAIRHFRDYLRLAAHLDARERKEIEGYIAELERLRAARSSPGPATAPAATTAPVAAPPTAATPEGAVPPPPEAPAPSVSVLPSVSPLPSGPPPDDAPAAPATTPSATASPTATATTSATPSPAGGSTSITRKWWFWAGVGGLVLGGVIVAIAASGGSTRLPCPGGATCP